MSDWYDTEIEELILKIPKKDFPLESDMIKGFEYPKLYLPEDECDDETNYEASEEGNLFVWNLKGICVHSNYNEAVEDLKEIVLKYGGTLIAKCIGEDDEEYLRIRDGKQKKVKIVEED